MPLRPKNRASWLPLFAAFAAIGLSLLLCSHASAQTAGELVQDARIKMKLKDYDTAAAILEEARQKYPSSVEVAQATVELCEETKDSEALIGAYGRLIETLQLKEVKEGTLSSKESKQLKDAKKKLQELVKTRWDTDAAVEDFVKPGIETCKKLLPLKKYVEACFVLKRLSAFEVEKEEVGKLMKQLGEENARLVEAPEDIGAGDDEKATRLLVEAQKLFKSGELDEAYLTCKAALEVDPAAPAAWALLCDITSKTGKTKEMLTHGLTYLLFPAQAQSYRRAEEIERRISKESAELKSFFAATKKSASKLCSLARKAVKEKKEADVEYVLERLLSMTHRTKSVDSILSKSIAKRKAKSRQLVKLGRTLFHDDFTSPQPWYLRDGYAWFEKGRYFIKSDNLIWLCRGPSEFKPGDFYAEVETQLAGNAKERTASGLCFRVVSNNDYYVFLVSADGRFGAWVVAAAKKRDLTGKEPKTPPGTFVCGIRSKYIKKGKAKNLVAVAFVGSKLFCYVNKHLVWTGEDKTFSCGTIGCSVNGGNNIYAFDNFKVTEASLPGR